MISSGIEASRTNTRAPVRVSENQRDVTTCQAQKTRVERFIGLGNVLVVLYPPAYASGTLTSNLLSAKHLRMVVLQSRPIHTRCANKCAT